MDELISVIVPVYNVESYLNKCIRSIVNQTYDNLEIILVDDGSTDESGDLCDRLANRDARIKVIHKQNGGLSSARNVGIDMAKGQYIGFVDSDDYIADAMYEKLLKQMIQHNADISICDRWYEKEDGNHFLRYGSKKQVMVMNSEQAILEMNSYRSFDMSACDRLYKRKLFDHIRFPEGRLSEDFFIMYRLFDQAERICYISQPLYFYVQRSGSISHNKRINYDFAEAARQQMEFVEKKYPALFDCVHSAYASANMTVYNFHKKNRVRCIKKNKKMLQNNVRMNMISIKRNRELTRIKKIQAYLFAYCIPLYNVLFVLYKKIKGSRY